MLNSKSQTTAAEGKFEGAKRRPNSKFSAQNSKHRRWDLVFAFAFILYLF